MTAIPGLDFKIRDFRHTLEDHEIANEKVLSGGKLSEAEFAIMVWDWTGIPTAPCLVLNDKDGKPYQPFRKRIVTVDGKPAYHRLDTLCARNDVWYEESNGEIAQWAIRYLADEADRAHALLACDQLANRHDYVAKMKREARAKVDAFMQGVKRVKPARPEAPPLTPEKRAQLADEAAQVKAKMTPEPDPFAMTVEEATALATREPPPPDDDERGQEAA